MLLIFKNNHHIYKILGMKKTRKLMKNINLTTTLILLRIVRHRIRVHLLKFWMLFLSSQMKMIIMDQRKPKKSNRTRISNWLDPTIGILSTQTISNNTKSKLKRTAKWTAYCRQPIVTYSNLSKICKIKLKTSKQRS